MALSNQYSPRNPYAQQLAPGHTSAQSSISVALVEHFSLTPTMTDAGVVAIETFLSIVRDREEAYYVNPHGDYEIMSWGHDISIALRANVSGEWTSCAVRRHDEVGYGPLQYGGCGDAAVHRFEQYDHEVLFELVPEWHGDIFVWAFVYVDGVFLPFSPSSASDHVVDANGALRAHAVL